MNRFLFIVFLFSLYTLSAQENVFKVDCGRDTTFCVGTYRCGTCYYIGSRVKLANGVPPYQFAWSCKPRKITTTVTFSASDFLNDTTIVNPYAKDLGVQNKPWRFYLKVRDSNDKVSIDSIDIQCSTFIFSTYEINLTLYIGDSIQFHNDIFVGGGIPPVKYYWTPGTGLDDPTRIDAWCKPIKTTSYRQYIIDSAGCKSDPYLGINVKVIPTSVENQINDNRELCLHQIGNKLLFNNLQGRVVTISFYAIDGKLLLTAQTKDSSYDIPRFEGGEIIICIVEIDERKETIKIY